MVDQARPFVFQKRDIFYFSRRIPRDLKVHYCTPRIVISLRTKVERVAQSRARVLAAQLDEEWLSLRLRVSQSPLSRFLLTRSEHTGKVSDAPTMSEAKRLYLTAKGEGRSKTFERSVERCTTFLVQLLGDRPIDTYQRGEINQLRDTYRENGLSRASIRRNFNTLRAIANFAARETGTAENAAFSGVYLGEDEGQEKRRKPIPIKTVKTIQEQCHRLDDEARWLVALISDTGMRLSEAVGLIKEDVVLEAAIPHIKLVPHPWRRLKTKGSQRVIPLVGHSLWAAQRAMKATEGDFLFPKYCDREQCKANSASGALNKWLRPRVPEGCVIHSFRHSMRDRLRAVECPPDIIDRIGGWSVGGIGESYGQGYPLRVLAKWLANAVAKQVAPIS